MHTLSPLGPHNLPSEPQLCRKSHYREGRGRKKKKKKKKSKIILAPSPRLSLFKMHFKNLLAGNLLELQGRLLVKSWPELDLIESRLLAVGVRSERAPWGGSAQSGQEDRSSRGGREPCEQRAPSAATPRRPWIWRVWVLWVWVGEPWAASLSSCLLNWIQAVCFALAMHRAFRRVRQRATHRSHTDPALRQPGSRQRDPKVCLAAPGHRSPFQGIPPQRFSHSTAKRRADAECFSLLSQTAQLPPLRPNAHPFHQRSGQQN